MFRNPTRPSRKPTEDDNNFESRLEDWEEAQAQACSLNRSHCNRSTRGIVSNANTTIEMLTKPKVHYTLK